MSIIDARKCDYCFKTADRTTKEDAFWRVLGHMSDDGSPRTRELITKHFCSNQCLHRYLENVGADVPPAREPELVP